MYASSFIGFRTAWPLGLVLLVLAGSGGVGWAERIWRVDFNGAAADTLVLSNFTGWTVSSASRTQSFAQVESGAATGEVVVSLSGSGGATWSTFQRTMSAGPATNLFRDGVQYNGTSLTVQVSGLEAGRRYAVRCWFFDDEFSLSGLQTYAEVGAGGSSGLGVLTNVATANLAAGQPGLPQDLYDPRYVLTALLFAADSGSVTVTLVPGSGNIKLNALEVVEQAPQPRLIYAGTTLSEAGANDGSLGNALAIAVQGASCQGQDGEDFIATGRAVATAVPAGLQATLLRTSVTNLIFTLAGVALQHAASDSITNLALSLLDDAFVSVPASSVLQAARADLRVSFNDPTLALTTNGLVLAWSSVPGQWYTVEAGSHPAGPFVPVATHIPADLALTRWTSSVPVDVTGAALFRIRVE